MKPSALSCSRRLLGLLACLLVLALAACDKKPPPPAARLQGSLAVAGFTQPRVTAELMAGSLPETLSPPAGQDVLRALDGDLNSMLTAQPGYSIVDASQARALRNMRSQGEASGLSLTCHCGAQDICRVRAVRSG